MAKNNHFSPQSYGVAEAANRLGEGFIHQSFVGEVSSVEDALAIAAQYTKFEKSMAVLSDLKNKNSYIHMGHTGYVLGLGAKDQRKVVPSIWEEEIFARIPDQDLIRKHVEELKFYNFIKRQPVDQRERYRMFAYLSISDNNGQLLNILHRITYLCSSEDGSIAFAVCLYNLSGNYKEPSYILDMEQGNRISLADSSVSAPILSDREKDVLRLISKGVISKEIADQLSISIHTVNRHRQNILEKLQSSNSHEACLRAKMLGELV